MSSFSAPLSGLLANTTALNVVGDNLANMNTQGFKGNTVPTMDTGCEGVAEFHFLDDDTVLFALNNSIYRMERAKN